MFRSKELKFDKADILESNEDPELLLVIPYFFHNNKQKIFRFFQIRLHYQIKNNHNNCQGR